MTESKDLARRVEKLEAKLQKAKGKRERQIEEKRAMAAELKGEG